MCPLPPKKNFKKFFKVPQNNFDKSTMLKKEGNNFEKKIISEKTKISEVYHYNRLI